MGLYHIGRDLSIREKWIYEILGLLCILLVWTLFTIGASPILDRGILPSPAAVWNAGGELVKDNNLIPNFFYSLGLNLAGYVEAILIAIPFGFILGLVPQVRAAFQRPVDSTRFLVLPAAVGLFIAWFGIGTSMKVHFLAFGIIIYLLPVTIQRIDEIESIYLRTVYTLGASKWQMIKTVYLPAVISRLFGDIRILTAISWTYIVIAESIGGGAGIGALTWQVGLRRGRIDKVFFLLIIIMLVGIIQDKIFGRLDDKLFPYKYQFQNHNKLAKDDQGLIRTISGFASMVIWYAFLVLVGLLLLDELIPIIGGLKLLSQLFLDTLWVVVFIYLIIIASMIYNARDRIAAIVKPKAVAS